MKKLIKKVEGVLKAIRESELKKNPKASAKAQELKAMIEELKTRNLIIQGSLR